MNDQLCQIHNMNTAEDTWKALKDYNERNMTICNLKLEEVGDEIVHISHERFVFKAK